MRFTLKPTNRGASDDDMLKDLQRCASELGQLTITPKQYREIGRFGERTFAKRFGSWSAALQRAKLSSSRAGAYTHMDLFENIRDLWLHLGRQPEYREVRRPASRFAVKVYRTTFGSWSEALQQFVVWANDTADENPQAAPVTTEQSENQPTPKRRRTPRDVSERQRFRVLLRDGFRCRSCGSSPLKDAGVNLHVDHIIPWAKGGETVDDNLGTKCERCNLGKGAAFSA